MDKNDYHHGLKLNATAIALLGVFFGAIMVATIHCIFNSCRYSSNINQTGPTNNHTSRVRRRTAVAATGSTTTIAVPVSRYSKECNEEMCSVCLSEFKVGEEIRVLPECLHVFHVDCIDMWLISHSNCPLCRSNTIVAASQSRDVVVRIETDFDRTWNPM